MGFTQPLMPARVRLTVMFPRARKTRRGAPPALDGAVDTAFRRKKLLDMKKKHQEKLKGLKLMKIRVF
jgi:hypothetical protein